MKADRLYAITVYLLNHGRTTAAELAQRFEVSVRTVRRDMETLCMAGIPLIAETGIGGGYSLAESFRMDAQTATGEEYALILAALKSYATAGIRPRNGALEAVTEKISALAEKKDNGILLDFSVLQERDGTLFSTLQAAIRTKRRVRFLIYKCRTVGKITLRGAGGFGLSMVRMVSACLFECQTGLQNV